MKQKYNEDKWLTVRLAEDTFTCMKFYTELNPVKIGVADVEKILGKSLQ